MKRSILLITLLTLVSCATIFSKGEDTIKFTSEPSGATILLNGQAICKTPCSHTLDRSTFEQFHVIVKKDGYQSDKYMIKKTLTTAAVFNLTSILSWATDVSSGNMIMYSPTSYFSELDPKSGKKSAYLKDDEAFKFVMVNMENIKNDLSRGQGEYLESLSKLIKKNQTLILSKKEQLLKTEWPHQFYKAL